MIRRLIFAALLASVVVPTSPRLLKNLRVARELRPLSMDARREKLMPDSYAAIEKIRTTVPMSERIALMGVSRESLDEALFLNYYLFPHPTKTFRDRWEYLSARQKPKVLVRLGPTLTLEPAHIVKILTIRGIRTFYDLVYECFGVMEFSAWVHVSSDVPIRGAFWLVNRAARTAAPLHLPEGPLTRRAPFPVEDLAANMWLLNLGS